MTSDALHFVACNYPALGHTRPMLGLVSRLIRNSPHLIITLFVYAPFVPATRKELSSLLLTSSHIDRVRIVGLGTFNSDATTRSFEALFAAYATLPGLVPPSYKEIVSGGSVTCSATDSTYDYKDVPSPTLVLSDICTPFAAQAIKAITPNIKIVVSWMATTSFFIYRFGPANLGGLGWLEEKATTVIGDGSAQGDVMQVAARLESDFKSVAQVNAEDLPMYDYEVFPQDIDNSGYTPVYINADRQNKGWADGVAVCSTGRFEPAARDVLRKWYGEEKKAPFFVGPYTSAPESPISEGPICSFLETHPKQSVWLIAFGTLFYPAQHPSHIETVLRTLLKHDTPFIMACGSSMFTPLPEDLVKEATARGLGHFADFIPQKAVLAHPSVGVFVSHAGVNSMFESIEAGVLNVFWPMTCDQPFHATHMTIKLDCAFELIQVRKGVGAGPLLRGATIEGTDTAIATEVEQLVGDINGPVGVRKRRNLMAVRTQLLDDLSEGGDADREVRKLIEFGSSASSS